MILKTQDFSRCTGEEELRTNPYQERCIDERIESIHGLQGLKVIDVSWGNQVAFIH